MERDQASKFVNDLLRLMISRNGSDLFLTADFPPAIKVDGRVTKVSPQPLTGQHTMALCRSIMNDKQAAEFERTKECNFAISPQGIGRFRCNAYVQQGNVGLVLRVIPQQLPSIDGLGLPQILKDVAMSKRGLVIFVGATGSGKSTSMAAMIDFREERRAQLLMDLSLNLKALVSQRLLPRQEGKGRIAAVEIMLNSPLIADLIFKGEVVEIKELMKRSRELGMQTFDQSLFDLYE